MPLLVRTRSGLFRGRIAVKSAPTALPGWQFVLLRKPVPAVNADRGTAERTWVGMYLSPTKLALLPPMVVPFDQPVASVLNDLSLVVFVTARVQTYNRSNVPHAANDALREPPRLTLMTHDVPMPNS